MRPDRPRDLDAEVAAELREIVAQLPPLSDPQLDDLADLLVQIDLHRQGPAR